MKAMTALLLASALALAACGSSDDNASSTSSGTKSSASSGGAYGSSSSTKAASQSEGSNEVEMYDNYFQPKTVTGKPGSTVTLELKNEGKAEHSFSVDSQKVDKEVEGGEDAKVSVKIPASGSVAFYCKYHKALGMTGTLQAQ